jgi:2-aminobenzoate-CoA ligase
MRLPGGVPTAHVDTFACGLLPAPELFPRFDYSAPFLSHYPDRLNAAETLIDRAVSEGHGAKPVYFYEDTVWSFGQLLEKAEKIARVLVEDFGLVPGGRVMIRTANTPMAAACWLAVLKAGGICVSTMALLRARELAFMLNRAKISIALCETALADEMELAKPQGADLRHVSYFSPVGAGQDKDADLDRRVMAKPSGFKNVETAADDVALITFTSGTTGNPKGAMHFHRDILAVCECWPKVYTLEPDEIVSGTPSFAFTYGKAAFMMYPMFYRCAAALPSKPTPEAVLETIERRKVTSLYTVPTAYNAILQNIGSRGTSSLRKCTSAGEHLRLKLWEDWHEKTGIKLVNGLGMTEFLTHFVSESLAVDRVGSTGRAVPGYTVVVLDDEGKPMPPGNRGRLAAIGPSGGRYLDDPERQAKFVMNGWNVTGDIMEQDKDGWFWYVDRSDDMIVSSGYNISAQEVERVILDHPKVAECAVVGVPDDARGRIVRACIVLREPADNSEDTVREIQDFVKNTIAPYKYPRDVRFLEALPKTLTGKIQRFMLRDI